MTVKHTLVSLDMRVFALCSLMELHRRKNARGCLGDNGGSGAGKIYGGHQRFVL